MSTAAMNAVNVQKAGVASACCRCRAWWAAQSASPQRARSSSPSWAVASIRPDLVAAPDQAQAVFVEALSSAIASRRRGLGARPDRRRRARAPEGQKPTDLARREAAAPTTPAAETG
jgi:hypothetical protein